MGTQVHLTYLFYVRGMRARAKSDLTVSGPGFSQREKLKAALRVQQQVSFKRIISYFRGEVNSLKRDTGNWGDCCGW